MEYKCKRKIKKDKPKRTIKILYNSSLKDFTEVNNVLDFIQPTFNVKKIRMLTTNKHGMRISSTGVRGKLVFTYIEEKLTGNKFVQTLIKNQFKSLMIERREISIKHNEWSRADEVTDTYTIVNRGISSVSSILVPTEYFRDELQIYDSKGKKLSFKSIKDREIRPNISKKEGINDEPYIFEVHLENSLSANNREVIALKYKIISNNPTRSTRIISWLKDLLPFYENDDCLFNFIDVERTLTDKESRNLTFTLNLAEGTTATSYLVLGIDDAGKVKAFDSDKDNELNYYSEGRDVFFSLSENRLKDVQFLLIFLKVRPQSRLFYAVSSIQLLVISLLILTGIVIHFQQFVNATGLITGLMISILTLFLIPEKSRLEDVRIGVAGYSIILSAFVILHTLSIFFSIRIIQDILNFIPLIYFEYLVIAGVIFYLAILLIIHFLNLKYSNFFIKKRKL
jgi:hypothetical protein